MKKVKFSPRPIPQAKTRFEELYEDLSADWRLKAERLQMRRWYKINNRAA